MIEAAPDDLAAFLVSFAQTPTEMDFGYTFVAVDPDGHRIRVFWPKEES